MKARRKFSNIITERYGQKFHSKGEANRYEELLLLQSAKEIRGLKTQPAFDIVVNEKKICKCIWDFEYFEKGKYIVEDFKGFKTDVYQLKKKLFEAVYPGIIFRESKAK